MLSTLKVPVIHTVVLVDKDNVFQKRLRLQYRLKQASGTTVYYCHPFIFVTNLLTTMVAAYI
jgi:hypothetical protein